MAQVQKGIVLSLEANGTRARVQPASQSEQVSRSLVIPWHMRGSAGNLAKGTAVAFVIFEDQSGLLLSRMDGSGGTLEVI